MDINTITVAELIELLQQQDPTAHVVFATNYGDRARTQQAHEIRGRIEEVTLVESGYSDSGYAIGGDDDNGAFDEDAREQADCQVFLRIR